MLRLCLQVRETRNTEKHRNTHRSSLLEDSAGIEPPVCFYIQQLWFVIIYRNFLDICQNMRKSYFKSL